MIIEKVSITQDISGIKRTKDQKETKTSDIPGYDQVMTNCSMILAKCPTALDFQVHKNDNDRHYYAFDDVSNDASESRRKIRAMLKGLYDRGAYSYSQFATTLRVPALSIQSIMEDDFMEENNYQL